MRFSLLTPTRDRADWLPWCIESVLDQTFQDWEQIILDNGSTSVKHLVPDDPRIRYVRSPASGPADAFQQTLDLARGEIVHPLSDDDELVPHALEVVDEKIGDAEWLTALTSFCDTDGVEQFKLGGPLNLDRLRAGYYLGGAVYWKRSLTDRLGGFDETYDGAADYDLYLRFAKDSAPVFVDRVLYLYTDHPDTDSHVRRNNQMAMTAAIQRAG